ncbi:hypothetical protein KC19_1G206400, partial [Ceratodon purpureus]
CCLPTVWCCSPACCSYAPHAAAAGSPPLPTQPIHLFSCHAYMPSLPSLPRLPCSEVGILQWNAVVMSGEIFTRLNVINGRNKCLVCSTPEPRDLLANLSLTLYFTLLTDSESAN